jgi:hypothetical protein
VRIIAAELFRLDSGGQVAAERGDDLSDSVNRFSDPRAWPALAGNDVCGMVGLFNHGGSPTAGAQDFGFSAFI